MENLDYGIIGNCRSAALISKKGSIDWCCLPEFNSSSVFAKILDKEKGGSFEIECEGDTKIDQKYIDFTNILRTRFENKDYGFVIYDFMPRYENADGHYSPPDIIRFIRVLWGKPKVRVTYNPRLEYASYPVETEVNECCAKSYTTEGAYDSLYLYSNLDLKKVIKRELIELVEDSFFLISYNQKILEQSVHRINLKFQRTRVYWLNWSERNPTFKKYNNDILRSALVLKLLSYDKTGAVLAAATTSLPETIGENRNWDYRFCWLRDASMVVKVMTKLGHFNVAKRYMKFVIDIIPDKDERIQIMYGIRGEKQLTEIELDHLAGYENSVPVRIGNDAYRQKQNDIYGILMDVILQQFEAYETSLQNGEDLWTIVRSIVKIVKENWRLPDRGIWEIRNEQKHFTFSKVLCWVAIDRAMKIASKISKSEYMEDLIMLKASIREDILTHAWNDEVGAFTQFYGSNDLDASVLLMESYGFIDAKDDRYIKTVKAVQKELSYEGLMYRYKNEDDFGLPSSSFTICTFWLINSLINIGEIKEAEQLFQQILKYSNHVGLYSEDIDFKSKRMLGNIPQAYSHLALIETAINLNQGFVSDEDKIMEALQ